MLFRSPHSDDDQQDTKVYFNNGYTDVEERKKGFVPTNQSNAYFHWHIVYAEKVTKENREILNSEIYSPYESQIIPPITEENLYNALKLIDPMGNLLTFLYQGVINNILKKHGVAYTLHHSQRLRKKTLASIISSTSNIIEIDNPEKTLIIAEELKQEFSRIREYAKQLHEISYLARYLFYRQNPQQEISFKKLNDNEEKFFNKAAEILGYNYSDIQKCLDNVLWERNQEKASENQPLTMKFAKIQE